MIYWVESWLHPQPAWSAACGCMCSGCGPGRASCVFDAGEATHFAEAFVGVAHLTVSCPVNRWGAFLLLLPARLKTASFISFRRTVPMNGSYAWRPGPLIHSYSPNASNERLPSRQAVHTYAAPRKPRRVGSASIVSPLCGFILIKQLWRYIKVCL